MFTPEIFIIFLFVLVDDFFKDNPIPPKPGPKWSLMPSEAVTLLIFSQWARFRSEQDFYRYADKKLRYLFPDIPCREQINRQWRFLHDYVCGFFCHLAEMMEAEKAPYQALDATAIVTEMPNVVVMVGLPKLTSVIATVWVGMKVSRRYWHPHQKVSSRVLVFLSDKEQPMAETFFYLRANPDARIASIGQNSNGCYYCRYAD
jgi:hypothetical protein